MNYMTVRRKLAISTWSAPREGNIYGKLTLDATQALRYIEHLRSTTGERITITHLVGKAVAMALAEEPSLNGRIFLGRFVPHATVDITWLVSLEDGRNLAKAKVERADTKTLREIAGELSAAAEKLRKGKDEQFNKSQGPLKALPTWLIRPVVWLTGWLTAAAGINMPAFGLERFPFGSAIVTSVGMFGLDEGYAPPTPFARVPVYVLVGTVRPQPAVVDGVLVVQEQATLTATIDHRFMDGFQGGVLARVMRDTLGHPWKLDGLDAPPWSDDSAA